MRYILLLIFNGCYILRVQRLYEIIYEYNEFREWSAVLINGVYIADV